MEDSYPKILLIYSAVYSLISFIFEKYIVKFADEKWRKNKENEKLQSNSN